MVEVLTKQKEEVLSEQMHSQKINEHLSNTIADLKQKVQKLQEKIKEKTLTQLDIEKKLQQEKSFYQVSLQKLFAQIDDERKLLITNKDLEKKYLAKKTQQETNLFQQSQVIQELQLKVDSLEETAKLNQNQQQKLIDSQQEQITNIQKDFKDQIGNIFTQKRELEDNNNLLEEKVIEISKVVNNKEKLIKQLKIYQEQLKQEIINQKSLINQKTSEINLLKEEKRQIEDKNIALQLKSVEIQAKYKQCQTKVEIQENEIGQIQQERDEFKTIVLSNRTQIQLKNQELERKINELNSLMNKFEKGLIYLNQFEAKEIENAFDIDFGWKKEIYDNESQSDLERQAESILKQNEF